MGPYSSVTGILTIMEKCGHRCTKKKDDVKKHGEKMMIYKSRRDAR